MIEVYNILKEEKLYDFLERSGYCFINNTLTKVQ